MAHRKYERRREVGAYVRFTLTPDETEKLDKACKLDERSRSEFARICCLRGIHSLIMQFGTSEMISRLEKVSDAEFAKK